LREPEREGREGGRRGLYLRIAVSLALLVLLVLFVDWNRLGARLGAADPILMGAVVLLATMDRLLMAWKWWLLVRARDAALGLWAAVRAYYLASFAGYFLPMTVGADAVRIGALAATSRPAVLVASVVLERLIGALAQAVLAILSVATLVTLGLGARVGPAERWGLGAAVALAFLVFPFTFAAARWVAARIGEDRKWRRALRGLAEQYAGYAASTGVLCVFFALTLLEGGFPVAIHYAAGRALGLDPGWSFYIATVPLVFLVARLPVSLGGLGFLELSFVSLAGLLGVGWTDAFAIAGLATALYMVALAPGAVLYLVPATATVRAGAPRASDKGAR
jgi:glycosyltransferase 2 family protein